MPCSTVGRLMALHVTLTRDGFHVEVEDAAADHDALHVPGALPETFRDDTGAASTSSPPSPTRPA